MSEINLRKATEDDLQLGVFEQIDSLGHEEILFCQDKASGLKAIIAIHNTVLGPALGGTRMWAYSSESEALNDVVRLSRGMTYKNSISGLDLGGGKAVIIGDSRSMKSEALFRRFGYFVNTLAGKYITAEDVGIDPEDMLHVSKETKHVVGLPGKSGDPSPLTAFGVYMGMKASAKFQYGTDSLKDKVVVVQGVGHVGQYLVEHLTKEGAKVMITDIHEDVLKRVSSKFGATVVDKENFYDLPMDIYAPCALGATINDNTLSRLKCSIIAGAANNQLKVENVHGNLLLNKGIAYAPDFAINAGGVINCFSEVKEFTREWSYQKAGEIYDTITDILKRSSDEKEPTYKIAMNLAEERIQAKLKSL